MQLVVKGLREGNVEIYGSSSYGSRYHVSESLCGAQACKHNTALLIF